MHRRRIADDQRPVAATSVAGEVEACVANRPTVHPPVRPNPSLHPGPATAGGVSPVCASGSIVTHRAYTARLRGPGELER